MKLPIPDKIKKTWDMWNLRGCVISSLFLQAFLALFATSRRRCKNSILLLLIWGAYLLADWIAAVAIGLSIKSQDDDKSCEATKGTNQDIAAFWASFLLLHLGGPDSITSFALEDNEFWLRHLFGLFLQALAAAYSFYLSLPKNKLWPLTVLVYLVGIVKYAERTRALYLASLDSLVASLLPKPEPGPDYEETSNKVASRWMLRFPIQGEATRMPNTSSVDVRLPYGRDFNVRGTLDKIKLMSRSSSEKVTEELERFIFDYVKGKSSEKAINLKDALAGHTELKWSIREFKYIESLLLWHIATEICHLHQNSSSSKRKWWKLPWHMATKICRLKENSSRRKCKLLSDYMFYLLITQPKMFSTILGSWYIVFQDTLADAKRFFSKHSISDHSNALHRMLSLEAESRVAAAAETESKSVFYAAINLAKQLQRLGDDRWDIMDRMWAELMCYAAINCRPLVHAQQVGMGGELLSFTWLLMKHFGLGLHFSAEQEE